MGEALRCEFTVRHGYNMGLCRPSRFWSGMYNRFEKGLQPRQSVTDYLMAVKEETQQLEEELEALEEVRHTFPAIALHGSPSGLGI